jgi:peroxiredoxin
MTITVGDVAPDFVLRDSNKAEHRLSDSRGKKVVLQFFPFAFTGICTQEVCDVRDRIAEFVNDDTVLYSISCDSVGTLKAFAEKEGFTHPLLSDFWPHGQVAQQYGVFLDAVGAANRATFVLDRDGVVRWAVTTALGQPRDPNAYISALKEIA